jgi:tetratricopeptide (TPR) repeat protein
MNKTTNSFLIVGQCSKGVNTALPEKAGGRELSAGILHVIANRQESFAAATRRLIHLADLAYGARNYDALAEISETLQAIPYAPAQRAATYYQAILIKRQGKLERAADLLSKISAPRALLTLGTIEECRGNWTEAARLHVEALRAGRDVDPFAVAGAAIQLATIRAIEGDHAGALDGFQAIAPLIRAAAPSQPSLYPIWHNAVAVELAELGRLDEARAASQVATRSPFADCYPEFEQTADELRESEPARIVVTIVEPQREEKRQEAKGNQRLITYYSSLITHQWSVASGQWSVFITAIIRTRAASRARPRAPPFISIA